MNRPASDPELRDAIRELAPGVDTSAFCRELGEKCAKKKPGPKRGRRLRPLVIGAAVVVVLAGVSAGLVTGLGFLRGPQPVIVFTDATLSPGAAGRGSSGPVGSSADTLTGAKAELWAEIERIRQGVVSGEVIFDWPSEAAQGIIPSDPLLMLDYLEQSLLRPDVTAYLHDSAGDAVPLRTEISAMSGVRMLEFVSKDDALQRLKDDFADSPEILEGLQENPLPAGLEIWLTDYTQAASLADQLRDRPEVDEVHIATMDYADWVATLQRLTHPSDETSQLPGLETTRTTYVVAPTTDDPPLSSTTTIMGNVGPRLSWGQEAVLDGRTIKVEQPVEAPDETGAPSGFVLVYSLVTITNTGSEPLTCAAAQFGLDGNSSGSTGGFGGPAKTLAGHEVLDLVRLQPGESVKAAVRFCVKQGDHPVKVWLGTRSSTGRIQSSTSEWLASWQ